MQIIILFYIELIATFLGWIITGIVVTFGYINLKFLSSREKEIISISCFLNFMVFYIYKEFRPDAIAELKIQYGIAEAPDGARVHTSAFFILNSLKALVTDERYLFFCFSKVLFCDLY
ncbi:hypothetical protein [Ursidibacter sp. B-7004-1]